MVRFSLMVTLIWLYMEILRLLAKIKKVRNSFELYIWNLKLHPYLFFLNLPKLEPQESN